MPTTPDNPYAAALGIAPPRLEEVVDHPEAKPYSLLIVALVEHGAPMTLAEAAERLAKAGAGESRSLLASLKRCRPGRPPIYRDGDRYALDPYDDEADLWVFRLGLRPPKVEPAPSPEPEPLPGPEVPLMVAELEEGWGGESLSMAWSARRVALAVLDAYGQPMAPEEVGVAASRHAGWHLLKNVEAPHLTQKGSPIRVLDDGRWTIAEGVDEAVRTMRRKVRERIAVRRKYARPTAAEIQARTAAHEERRRAHRKELEALRRAIIAGFPHEAPRVLAVIDADDESITTYAGPDVAIAWTHLASYDLIAGVDVRAQLRGLGLPPDRFRLAELGPPQRTYTLSTGHVMELTTRRMVEATCGLRSPSRDAARRLSLDTETLLALKRAMVDEVVDLHMLYAYARLHGVVLVQRKPYLEPLPVPWLHWDEQRLFDQMKLSVEAGVPLDVLVQRPPLNHRWRGAIQAHPHPHDPDLLQDARGRPFNRLLVQRARLARTLH